MINKTNLAILITILFSVIFCLSCIDNQINNTNNKNIEKETAITEGSFVNEELARYTATVSETAFYISFVDERGDDLLNPVHSNAITEENTNLYYLKDGISVMQFHANLDRPKMFYIVTEQKLKDRNYMIVFSNIIKDQDTAITYLEFEDSSKDTIKAQYVQGENYTQLTKIWYNGDLKCNVYDKSIKETVIEDRAWCYITVTHNL